MTTNDYVRHVRESERTSLAGKLWQRNYHEHIVRNEAELNKIREYIATNPSRWSQDRGNPAADRDRDEESPWL
jgi:REP element-mobilizing transposase RayT